MDEHSIRKVEALYFKYNRIMYDIAHRILCDHPLTQDAIQMSFIKIIENIDKIVDVDCNKTKAFLVIICRNIAINIYNKRKYNNLLFIDGFDETISDNAFNADEQLINLERLSLLKEKINMLYEPYADIITLKYIFDYSDKELSEILDISEQNVRVRLCRAKKSLIKLIQEQKGVDVV